MSIPPFEPNRIASPPPRQHPRYAKMELDQALEVEMPYGKHKGKTMREIADSEPTYIEWLWSTLITIRSGRLKDALPVVREAYSEEIAAAQRDRDSRR